MIQLSSAIYTLKAIRTTLRREIGIMCSDNVNSVLMQQVPDSLQCFRWDEIMKDACTYVNVFSTIMFFD